MNLIDTGLDKGLIRCDENRDFITYIHQNKKRNNNSPEEKVQAETFLTLVLIYGYPLDRIKQFVSVQMGAETKEADIIVYNDDECEETYILVECEILLKTDSCSCGKRTAVPEQSGHQFLLKMDKDSCGKRTAGPVQCGQ